MSFPGSYSFSYYRGDTYGFIARPKDSAGASFDLTGYTATFTIASARGPAPAESYAGTAVVNDVDNIVTCTITPTIGRDLDPALSWVYDLQITNGSEIFTILTGNISSTDDITGA
jgi:hypothetical protein